MTIRPSRLLATAAVLIASAVALPAAAQSMLNMQFQAKPTPKVLRDQGVEVTVTPRVTKDGDLMVSETIKVDGIGTLEVPEDEETGGSFAFPRLIGIGKFAETDKAASVLIEGYTGGAHCCTSLRAVVPVNGKLKLLDLGKWDGDLITEFPTDLNDDGVVDFQMRDNSFLYAFSSYAGSFAPPQFWNVRNGQWVDVSSDPKFAGWFDQFITEAREYCLGKDNADRNGACIGYVAASARVGKFGEAMKEAAAAAEPLNEFNTPTDCKVALVDYQCPEGQQITYKSFEEAARAFLRRNGYID